MLSIRPATCGRPRRIHANALALAGLLLAACGGGDSPVTPKPPVEKSCTEDPTQAKCNTTPPSTQTLSSAAAAKSRIFGTAVDALFTSGTNAAYFAVLAREFNGVTPGNVMKWSSIHRDSRTAYRFEWGDSIVSYAQTHGMKVHGHTLVWHNQNPTWLTSGTWAPDTLKAILLDHIATVVGHYKGKIFAWDVVNEGLADNGSLRATIWSNALGSSYIETAFRAARAADSTAELLYNDYNLEFPGAKQDAAYALVSDLKTKKLIDGIGFQAHFQINADGTGVPTRASLTSTFQRFAALGLKVHITELDVRVRTPGATQSELDAQSRAYGDVVAACLAVPACESITTWGISDSESWIPSTFPGWGQALLFDAAFTRKPAYSAVLTALTT